MPADIMFPFFICETCQVRSILGRELSRQCVPDLCLLMLERMRMVDQANYLAASTLTTYKYHIKLLLKFQQWSHVNVLRLTCPPQPPVAQTIILQWAHLRHTIHQRRDGQIGIKFQSARTIRSAANYYHALALQSAHPDNIVKVDGGVCYAPVTPPTSTQSYTMCVKGMLRRMGDEATPSWALAFVHIRYLDWALNNAYEQATDAPHRHELACAGAANLIGYLGWLRSTETFCLTYDDITVTVPHAGPTRGMPMGLGALEFRLLPETKSSPGATADVVVSWHTGSGLCLGKWITRLLAYELHTPNQPIFSTMLQPMWSSNYFRHRFAYPLLEQQRLSGEPTLQCFSNDPGRRLQDAVFSFNSWRRAGRSRVSRGPRCTEPKFSGQRTATKIEIHEHGRWRLKGEDMPARYNQWDLQDRVILTLLCM